MCRRPMGSSLIGFQMSQENENDVPTLPLFSSVLLSTTLVACHGIVLPVLSTAITQELLMGSEGKQQQGQPTKKTRDRLSIVPCILLLIADIQQGRMEKYRLVQEHKGDGDEFLEPTANCEVRITQQGKPRNYISYAMSLFADGSDCIVLKAMGRAINKGVTIAEILKRKMPLHQLNALSSVEMVDVFEPLEEGLDTVTSRRFVSCMKITLSKTAEGIDKNDIGYQPPLPLEEMHPGDFHPLREAALIASS